LNNGAPGVFTIMYEYFMFFLPQVRNPIKILPTGIDDGIITCPVSLSNLYILKPGLLAPSVVLFGVIDGASSAHETGRPGKLLSIDEMTAL
jgi:hypothetical protein